MYRVVGKLGIFFSRIRVVPPILHVIVKYIICTITQVDNYWPKVEILSHGVASIGILGHSK